MIRAVKKDRKIRNRKVKDGGTHECQTGEDHEELGVGHRAQLWVKSDGDEICNGRELGVCGSRPDTPFYKARTQGHPAPPSALSTPPRPRALQPCLFTNSCVRVRAGVTTG